LSLPEDRGLEELGKALVGADDLSEFAEFSSARLSSSVSALSVADLEEACAYTLAISSMFLVVAISNTLTVCSSFSLRIA
jgi:hypothetical protein